MKKMVLLSVAGILTGAMAVRAQYTPGAGGTYVGPSTPIMPVPGTAVYPPVVAPQPAAAGQPEAVRIVQPAATVVVPRLTDQQMADLTAAIALYPDALLAEIFPATTFIQQLTYADRWQEQHPGADEGAINALPVDDSVKALMHYPAVMDMLVGHLDWSQSLGIAFTYQRQDVMDSIQRWRATAVANGYLYSTAQQDVLQAGPTILIQPPPQTQVIYVPVYDPAVVYVRPAAGRPVLRNVITFGGPAFSLTFIHNEVDWRDHEIRVPRRDERIVVDAGPGGPPGGRGPAAAPKAVFVPSDTRADRGYPERVVTPQPDRRVITLPAGRGGPGRGAGDNPGRGPGDNPGRGPGDNPGRGPGGGGPPGRGGYGN
jgi:hypothetical protein